MPTILERLEQEKRLRETGEVIEKQGSIPQAQPRVIRTPPRRIIRTTQSRRLIKPSTSKKISRGVLGLVKAVTPQQEAQPKKKSVGRQRGVYTKQWIETAEGMKYIPISASNFKKYKAQRKRAKIMQKLMVEARQMEEAEALSNSQDPRFEQSAEEQNFLFGNDNLHSQRLINLERDRQIRGFEQQQSRTSMLTPIKEQIQQKRNFVQNLLSNIRGNNIMRQSNEINPQRKIISEGELGGMGSIGFQGKSNYEGNIKLIGSLGTAHNNPAQQSGVSFLKAGRTPLAEDSATAENNIRRNNGTKVKWF